MTNALHRILLCLTLVLGLIAPSSLALAQEVAATPPSADQLLSEWNRTALRAEDVLVRRAASTASLETLRAELAAQRAAALAFQQENSDRGKALATQLQSMGPRPTDEVGEAPEITARRLELSMQVARITVPVLAAQEAYQRANTLIGEIDALIRARLTSELVARGPTPLNPAYWPQAIGQANSFIAKIAAEISSSMANPVRWSYLLRQLPVIILALVAGLVILVTVRRAALRRIESTLSTRSAGRDRALWVAVLNMGRLALPALGTWAIYWAVDTSGILSINGQTVMQVVPTMAAILIGGNWLAHSLFSPRLARVRLVTLDDAAARSASRIVTWLSIIWALRILADATVARAQLSTETVAVQNFVLIFAGAFALWALARHITTILKNRGDTLDGLGRSFLIYVRRALHIVAILAPLASALGYFAAGRYLFYPIVQTMTIFAIFHVLNSLINDILRSLLSTGEAESRASSTEPRFLPVVVGFMLGCISLPFLALAWGARISDLTEVWVWVNDGVSIGDARFSLRDLIVLLFVFIVGYTVTRLLKKLMRTTVLPRTRMDAGGRNAILSGIGYVGYSLAALAAVSATGLDLSSLAIVAGALSVGIGFGLQNIVSNFVSGIILLIERPVKEGDWIEVSGFAGYVRGIRVRSTLIETFDRGSVVVPNADLIASAVLNRTHSNMVGRVRVPVGVAYGSDTRKVERILMEIAENHPMTLKDPAPTVMFMGFGADSLDFEIRVFLRDVNWSLSVHSDLNHDIARIFESEHIEIPYAQRDINFRNLSAVSNALRDAIHPPKPPAQPRELEP